MRSLRTYNTHMTARFAFEYTNRVLVFVCLFVSCVCVWLSVRVRLFVCVYLYTFTYIRTYMHTYNYIYTYPNACMCTYTYNDTSTNHQHIMNNAQKYITTYLCLVLFTFYRMQLIRRDSKGEGESGRATPCQDLQGL